MTTRRFAIAYLPTVGLWSLVRAVQFYKRDHSRRRAQGSQANTPA